MNKKIVFKDGSTRTRKSRNTLTDLENEERVLINELLIDIDEFGSDYEAVAIFNKDGKITDYALQQGEMMWEDEDAACMSLLDILVNFYILIMPTKIGAVIKAHRMALDMSQTDLALKLNTTQQNVAIWEKGTCLPSMKFIFSIKEILKIDEKWLV